MAFTHATIALILLLYLLRKKLENLRLCAQNPSPIKKLSRNVCVPAKSKTEG